MKSIKWEGDNQFEVEEFIGQDLECGDCPDDLVIPTANGNVLAKLGDSVIANEDGSFSVIKDADFHNN